MIKSRFNDKTYVEFSYLEYILGSYVTLPSQKDRLGLVSSLIDKLIFFCFTSDIFFILKGIYLAAPGMPAYVKKSQQIIEGIFRSVISDPLYIIIS